MKMLTLVCGEKIEDRVLLLLNKIKISGYTVISGVGGKGQTGTMSGRGWIDPHNTVYLIVLDDTPMSSLVNAVKELHARLVEDHEGRAVPLKVFLQPCEQIV
jgi:hypothetical protein